jgi:Fusaric acid resistance protein-like
MAIMCFGVGLSAAKGINRGMMLIPLLLACMIIAPPSWSGHAVDRTTTSYLLWMMLIFGGGALWAILIFPPLLRKRIFAPPDPNTRIDTLIYTVFITVLCTAGTLGVLIWYPGSKGAWLVVTLLVVTQVGRQETVKRTLARVAGTVVGVGIAAVVASLISTEAVLISIGVVLVVIALVIRQGPHYGLYMAALTPAVVLFSSTSIADVRKTDAQRLAFTLIAAALVLLASAIAVAWAHYQQTHTGSTATKASPAPTAA